MDRKNVNERLNRIFRDVFDDDSITVNDNTTSDDIEDWDSFEHINLVIAVEKRFQVKFTVGEANEMKNVGEMAYTPEAVRALLERGVRHVSIGSDQQIIAAGCKALLEAAYH